jgi:cytochrome c oxidase assembly protein Cox11
MINKRWWMRDKKTIVMFAVAIMMIAYAIVMVPLLMIVMTAIVGFNRHKQ